MISRHILMIIISQSLVTAAAAQTADSAVVVELSGFTPEVRSCQPCHLNPGLRMGYGDSGGRYHDLSIDPDGFRKSIHYRKDKHNGSDCHKGDYGGIPHAKYDLPKCIDCHKDIREEYIAIEETAKNSVHFTGDGSGFDCATCHSAHEMVSAREMSIARKNRSCIECHEGMANITGLTLTALHSWHPQAALHLDRIACISCHTNPTGDDFSFRHGILPREKATSDCYIVPDRKPNSS